MEVASAGSAPRINEAKVGNRFAPVSLIR